MSDTIISGDWTVYYSADNNQKRLEWTGSATGTTTLNAWYTGILQLFDDSAQMDDFIPITAITPSQYRLDNSWFVDDTSVEHLTGGSLFTAGWQVTTTEHILIIGYGQTTEFSSADIGRTLVGTDTGDTGTLLDFNTQRNLVWIRPTDPAAGGDEFDDINESYTIQEDDAAQVWTLEEPSTYVDMTSESTVGTNDLLLMPATESANDAVYFGFAQQFSKMTFNNASGTQGVDGGTTVAVWQYWNGSAWAALAGVTDGTATTTVAFTLAVADDQDVTFTIPTDWVAVAVNASAQLFYVRVIYTTANYSTNPIYDTMTFGGVGAGAFAIHGRHGEGSVAGESAWAGITSIGARETETSAYIFQENPDQPSGSFQDEKVAATKGTQAWWPHDSSLDILLKTKEADSIFGPDPTDPTLGNALFLMRQYSKTYSHF
jgi:hypothetical protein